MRYKKKKKRKTKKEEKKKDQDKTLLFHLIIFDKDFIKKFLYKNVENTLCNRDRCYDRSSEPIFYVK